jgi:hypothetical protein
MKGGPPAARYYNPLTGRFLSRDPEDGKSADPATLHKYLYAGGDPINGIDPSGRDSILETGAIDFDIILEPAEAAIRFGKFLNANVACSSFAISFVTSELTGHALSLLPLSYYFFRCIAALAG